MFLHICVLFSAYKMFLTVLKIKDIYIIYFLKGYNEVG
jgi:hypothetical protein